MVNFIVYAIHKDYQTGWILEDEKKVFISMFECRKWKYWMFYAHRWSSNPTSTKIICSISAQWRHVVASNIGRLKTQSNMLEGNWWTFSIPNAYLLILKLYLTSCSSIQHTVYDFTRLCNNIPMPHGNLWIPLAMEITGFNFLLNA